MVYQRILKNTVIQIYSKCNGALTDSQFFYLVNKIVRFFKFAEYASSTIYQIDVILFSSSDEFFILFHACRSISKAEKIFWDLY